MECKSKPSDIIAGGRKSDMQNYKDYWRLWRLFCNDA